MTFEDDGSVKRGTGGLVTALTGLASHRDAVWIASTMTDGDAEKAARARRQGRSRSQSPDGGEYQVRLVASDPEAYDRFYNIFANPMLWFIQHYLWDLSNAPDIRRHEVEAFEYGYNVVNEDLARAVIEEIEGVDGAGRDGPRLPPLHAAGAGPARAAGRLPAPLRPHPVDAARRLARAAEPHPRGDLRRACSPTTSSASTRSSYRRNFLQCCRDLMDLEVDFERGRRALRGPRGLGARLPAADRRSRRRSRVARAPSACASSRSELLRAPARAPDPARRPRGPLEERPARLHAFDLFLEQHPEFRETVTFIAQLMPSRTDVPEYAEYLERIEALVAVVNHRHGTPDWMPIDLKLRDDLEEAVAAYKHYDVLLVNAMFDGMNLVAKEGPLVNERDGVSILSRTRARTRSSASSR